MPSRLREHDCVRPTRLDDAPKTLLLIVAGGTHHHDEIESSLGELRLQPDQERDEEGFAELLVAGMRLQHEGDRVRCAAAKVPARQIGRVVELGGRGEHPLARLGIDVGAAVQRARNRADRDIQMAGEVADARHGSNDSTVHGHQ